MTEIYKHSYKYINNLSISLFEECICDKNKGKALAMFIYLKRKYPASVIKNFSIEKIRKEVNSSHRVVARWFNILNTLGLCERNGNIMYLKSIKSQRLNHKLTKFDFSSINSILNCLRCLYISHVQSQKDYYDKEKKAILDLRNNTHKFISKKEYKRIKKLEFSNSCGRIMNFEDKGISYKYIAEQLNISNTTITQIINYGTEHQFFICTRNKETIYVGTKGDNLDAFIEVNECNYSYGKLIKTHNSITWNKPNTYKNTYNDNIVTEIKSINNNNSTTINDIKCNTNSNNIINNNSNDDRYNFIPDNYIKDDITISSNNSNNITYNNITIRNRYNNAYINPYE